MIHCHSVIAKKWCQCTFTISTFARYWAGEWTGNHRVLHPAEDCVCGDGWRGQPLLEDAHKERWGLRWATGWWSGPRQLCNHLVRTSTVFRCERKQAWIGGIIWMKINRRLFLSRLSQKKSFPSSFGNKVNLKYWSKMCHSYIIKATFLNSLNASLIDNIHNGFFSTKVWSISL